MTHTVLLTQSLPNLHDENPSGQDLVTVSTATVYEWTTVEGDRVTLTGTFTYVDGVLQNSGSVDRIEIDLVTSGAGRDIDVQFDAPQSNLADLNQTEGSVFWQGVFAAAQNVTVATSGPFIDFTHMRDGFGAGGRLNADTGSVSDTLSISGGGTFSGDALRSTGADGAADVLTINRSSASDDLFVSGDFLYAAINGLTSMTGADDLITDNSTIGGETFLVGDVGEAHNKVSVTGGDDTITANGVSAVIIGDLYRFADTVSLTLNGGDDTLTGSSKDDLIIGDAFDMDFETTVANILNGGNDEIFGGTGADTIYGDVYLTETSDISGGDDVIFGGAQGDFIYGQGGADLIEGGGGADLIFSGGGADELTGNNGKDRLYGDSGADTLRGNKGDDRLYGGQKDDVLFGGAGSDTVRGGGDNDLLKGGRNGDTLNGGDGDDTLFGNQAADVFEFENGFGVDVIADFDASKSGEVIDLSAVATITDWTDLMTNHLSAIDGQAVIDDLNGNTITLQGVAADDLDAGSFIF